MGPLKDDNWSTPRLVCDHCAASYGTAGAIRLGEFHTGCGGGHFRLVVPSTGEPETQCEWCEKDYPTADRTTGTWHLLPGGVDVRCAASPRDEEAK